MGLEERTPRPIQKLLRTGAGKQINWSDGPFMVSCPGAPNDFSYTLEWVLLLAGLLYTSLLPDGRSAADPTKW